MKTAFFKALTVLLLAAMLPIYGRTQAPAAVRRVKLPSLDLQATARLVALDRRLVAIRETDQAAALLGQLASPAARLGALAPILANSRTREYWDQLPDQYYRMMQESGDSLALLPGPDTGFGVAWSSGQMRRLCQQRSTWLPRGSLDLYRQRVDAEAKALLEQARRTRSILPLRRIVDVLLASRYADDALDLLGDLRFERGDFDEARSWWRLLAQMGTSSPDRVLFPGTKLDLVGVQAKQILAQLFAGRLEEAQSEIKIFRAKHPGAVGPLAGQQGNYATILEKTLSAFVRDKIGNNDEPWTTFGGDATRNRTLSQGLSSRLWEDDPAWRVPLPSLNLPDDVRNALPDTGTLIRRVAFHPVIADQQVLIADHRSVVSYHLYTGKELFRYDLKAAGLADPGPGIDPAIAMPRFTLSAADGHAYVRLGALNRTTKKAASEDSWLVCLDLSETTPAKKREAWRVAARMDDESAYFEGSPLVRDGRVYIAWSKIAAQRVVTSIVCYDRLGRRRWIREVCDCPEIVTNHGTGQNLLTWASGQVVYASHSGAIVAVDSITGQPTWGVRYPSRGSRTKDLAPSPRDLAPCVYADGHVFAAPLDSERVFCIDAFSGRVRWELDGIEVVHLVGVAQGQLMVTTPTRMVAISTSTGTIDWLQPSEGWLPSLGRALIAGNRVIWPTQGLPPYRAVSVRNGSQQESLPSVLPEPDLFDPTRLSRLPAGNLAFGQGCLAIAGLEELVVYVPAHKHRPLPPIDPRPHTRLDSLYQRARWLASAGETDAADKTYQQLFLALGASPDAAGWRMLVDERRKALRPDSTTQMLPPTLNTLLARATQAMSGKRWGEAADAYRRALAMAATTELEARCLLGLARAYEGEHAYRSAWLTWMALNDRFGSMVEPTSKKPYAVFMPSKKVEPYLSALAATNIAGPALPLVQAWAHTDGRIWPLGDPRDDCFFCTQTGHIRCRSLDTGALRWSKNLESEPFALNRWHDLVVLTGSDNTQALRMHDGQSAWIQRARSRRQRLIGVREGKPVITQAAGFVHAQVWDDTLLVLDDQRKFLRFRLDTGAIAWQFAPAAANLRPLGAAAFEPYVARVGNGLLVQSVSGQPYRLENSLTPFGRPSRPWKEAPKILGKLLVRADEQGRILAQLPAPPHEVMWTYQAPWPNSLTGALCRLLVKDSVLLAAIPRNEGLEWIRLDAERGNLLWRLPACDLPDGLDIKSVCVGDTAFFYAHQQKLYARSLNDGRLQWTSDLPVSATRWGIGYTKDYLAVYPAEASKAARFQVSFVDPWQGSLLQRLEFGDISGAGDVHMTPNMVLISAGGRICGFRSLPPE